MPIPYFFYYYRSVVEFELRLGDTPDVTLLYRMVLAIPGSLFFHVKLSITLLRSVKNCVDILMGTVLKV